MPNPSSTGVEVPVTSKENWAKATMSKPATRAARLPRARSCSAWLSCRTTRCRQHQWCAMWAASRCALQARCAHHGHVGILSIALEEEESLGQHPLLCVLQPPRPVGVVAPVVPGVSHSGQTGYVLVESSSGSRLVIACVHQAVSALSMFPSVVCALLRRRWHAAASSTSPQVRARCATRSALQCSTESSSGAQQAPMPKHRWLCYVPVISCEKSTSSVHKQTLFRITGAPRHLQGGHNRRRNLAATGAVRAGICPGTSLAAVQARARSGEAAPVEATTRGGPLCTTDAEWWTQRCVLLCSHLLQAADQNCQLTRPVL